MHRRPLIGMSGSRNQEARHLFLRENYMESVLTAGGLPFLLPQVGDEETANMLLDRLDGLLLTGGVDVEPARYGEGTLEACGEVDLKRDAFELLIARLALERSMPIFGICRGIQLLTVLMGGTLWQDIESQLGIPRLRHYQEPPYDVSIHTVRFESGSLFERITGSSEIRTNSMHHQAVKDPGPRLLVEGRSEDGVIEAMRAANGDAVFAVQYHPEYLQGKAHAAALFAHHVKEAERYAQNK